MWHCSSVDLEAQCDDKQTLVLLSGKGRPHISLSTIYDLLLLRWDNGGGRCKAVDPISS